MTLKLFTNFRQQYFDQKEVESCDFLNMGEKRHDFLDYAANTFGVKTSMMREKMRQKVKDARNDEVKKAKRKIRSSRQRQQQQEN